MRTTKGRAASRLAAVLLCGPVLTWFPRTADASTSEKEAFARIAAEAIESGGTPGLAIAIVKDGVIHHVEALGKADLKTGRAVTRDTAFYIASTSKALTALAVACRAERGELDLDASLSRVLPGARFAEGIAPDSIRVRDLLTHTHGIDPMGPVSLRVAFTGQYTNEQLLDLLGAHHPAKDGRAFRYSNLGYDIVGLVLSPSRTHGWKDAVEAEVLRPIGMTATTAYVSRVAERDLAQPHELGPDGLERIDLAKEDSNMGPAGGHFASAPDLGRLLLAELSGGVVDGVQAVAARAVAETQRLQVPQDRDFAFYHRYGWGLGWDLGTYEGDTLIHRFGGFAGYRSHVSFMPGRGIGVVVLMNGGDASAGLIDVVATAIYDEMLGRVEGHARYLERLAGFERDLANARSGLETEREKRAARSQVLRRPMSDYAGRYTNDLMGTIELRTSGGALDALFGAARSRVEVYDTEKNQLRVQLLGRGSVLTVRFAGEQGPAEGIEFLDATFARE